MEFYTSEEVAKIFRVHKRTVDRWLKNNLLKGYKLGKGKTAPIRIPKAEVVNFLKKNQIK